MTPSATRMVARGAVKHCPRCGGGQLFHSWLKMKDRCPGCGHRFEREEDFFFGAYVINLAVTEGLLIVAVFAYIVFAFRDPDVSIWPAIAGGAVAAIAGPIVFYPFAKTIWAAIDLILRPPEPSEDGGSPPDGLGRRR